MIDGQFQFDFKPPATTLPELWTPDDIYNACDQGILVEFGEDRRVERKRVEVSQKDFAAYLSMWANTQPYGGVIFVGVDNEGKIRGCKHCSNEHLMSLKPPDGFAPMRSSPSRELRSLTRTMSPILCSRFESCTGQTSSSSL